MDGRLAISQIPLDEQMIARPRLYRLLRYSTSAARGVAQCIRTMSAPAATALQRKPASLHVLRLPEPEPDDQGWGDWWLLDDPEGEVSVGDLLHFEDKLTGAGECEGLRWALPAEVKGKWRLVPGDVESPVFPATLEQLTGGEVDTDQGITLRQLYEPGLEQLMALQGFSLADTFGGDSSEFWGAPDCSFKYPGTNRDAALWPVQLSSCTRVATHRFDAADAEPASRNG